MDKKETFPGMEASLNASIERQSHSREQQTQQQLVLQLGKDLERLMVGLAAAVEEIAREVDEKVFAPAEYYNFIDNLQDARKALFKVFAEWRKQGGPEKDPSVRNTVASLGQVATELIERVRNRGRKGGIS